jgi:chromosome segregation ATPase
MSSKYEIEIGNIQVRFSKLLEETRGLLTDIRELDSQKEDVIQRNEFKENEIGQEVSELRQRVSELYQRGAKGGKEYSWLQQEGGREKESLVGKVLGVSQRLRQIGETEYRLKEAIEEVKRDRVDLQIELKKASEEQTGKQVQILEEQLRQERVRGE